MEVDILIHHMNLHSEPYYAIESGKKDIELRLLDEKRQMIQVGDFIEFTNTENSECKLKVVVVALYRFPSFDKLYESLDLLRCGYTNENINRASPTDMDVYYSKEKQEKYGVVGIEIRVI